MFCYLPEEIRCIMYLNCDIENIKILSSCNKQIYNELSTKIFWMIYYRFHNIKLIDGNLNYNKPIDWMNEISDIKNIEEYVNIINIGYCANCEYAQYCTSRLGIICNKYNSHCKKYKCPLGRLNCGRLYTKLITIDNIQILKDKLSLNDINLIKDDEIIICNNRLYFDSKVFSINSWELPLILYQISKNIIYNKILLEHFF